MRALIWLVLPVLAACATTAPEREASAPDEPTEEGAANEPRLDETLLDGVFVAPGSRFDQYSALLVPALDLEQWHPAGRELPLKELNRNDRRFIQQTYSQALVHRLVMNGDYALAVDPAEQVLEVRGRLRQRVSPAREGRPRGTVEMVLTLDLVDSVSGDLLATMTERQPIDRSLGERGNRVTAMQIRRAFAQWMQWFRAELRALRNDG